MSYFTEGMWPAKLITLDSIPRSMYERVSDTEGGHTKYGSSPSLQMCNNTAHPRTVRLTWLMRVGEPFRADTSGSISMGR